MWTDRELDEEAYVPDHLLNHLTVKPPPPLRAAENNGHLDGGRGGGHHMLLQHHHLHHQGAAASNEYLGGRGNGVDMMEPMLAHLSGDQVEGDVIISEGRRNGQAARVVGRVCMCA
jgi:hypothetical protein